MSISISNSLSASSLTTANSLPNFPAQIARQAQPAPQQAPDTVQLSESQQVYQLYNQGQRVSQIATSLRLTVEAVNSYLGITSTSS